MKISDKHTIMIIGLLFFVISTSGCVEIDGDLNQLINYFSSGKNYTVEDTSYKNLNIETPVKTFSGYGVSFKYPSSWFVNSDNQTGPNIISVFKGVSLGGAQFSLEQIPNEGMTEESTIRGFQNSIIPGWTKKSSYWISIDSEKAYEDVYFVNDSNFRESRIVHIYLVKNNTTYFISLQAPDKDFDNEKPYFAMILNSLKIE